jgi:hypothetical protein
VLTSEDLPQDELLVREAALNDPREAQRTALTEIAKLLARRDWTGILEPTEDCVVFIAEHDGALAPKRASVREVTQPTEPLAAWDGPGGGVERAPRGSTE